MIQVKELLTAIRKRAPMFNHAPAIEEGGPRKWSALRKLYAELDADIRAVWPQQAYPYYVDWIRVFTPIEYGAWCSIRYHCVPLYPQYPVGKFFVDFADPVARIAVECDGKQWHDAKRDAIRDVAMAALGWEVHRFTSRQCWLPAGEGIDAWIYRMRLTHWHRYGEVFHEPKEHFS